jgi:transposase
MSEERESVITSSKFCVASQSEISEDSPIQLRSNHDNHVENPSYSEHISQVQHALRSARSKSEFQRILCIWLKMSFSFTSEQLAIAIGRSPVFVRKIQSRFAKESIQCFAEKKKGGRKREYISFEREEQILTKFHRQAQRGNSMDVQAIRKAYELSVGKEVSPSTVYRLIARHGLRRYLPRSRQEKCED